MNDLIGIDWIPDPKVIIAGLYACRRLNDYACTVRFLEGCREKCKPHGDKYYAYLLQEIGPALCELGIETPEALGWDKPELWLESQSDIH